MQDDIKCILCGAIFQGIRCKEDTCPNCLKDVDKAEDDRAEIIKASQGQY